MQLYKKRMWDRRVNACELLVPHPFLHGHTHYWGNVHDHAQNPLPTKSRDLQTKIGKYTNGIPVPHPHLYN